MSILKQDLLNQLNNDKYFKEKELARLAQDPNMNYKIKVDEMSELLKKISEIDLANQLVGKYFQDQPLSTPQVKQQVHQGQSHGE
jgi:hypothetical protein